jgi:hypothetical protein
VNADFFTRVQRITAAKHAPAVKQVMKDVVANHQPLQLCG